MLNKSVLCIVLIYLFQSYEANRICKPSERKKLVIDQDGGADDAMATFMALLYERHLGGPEVIAITMTNGNVNEDQVFKNTQRILDIAERRRVPIYRGSKRSLVITRNTDCFFGRDGLGENDTVIFRTIPAQRMHAVYSLIEMSKKYKENLIIISIGPLTNLALAIRLDPGFLGRISQLYVGAGRIPDEENPKPEFNALMDVEAYRIVADHATPEKVTVISYGIVQTWLNLSREWREDVLGAIPTRIINALNVFEQISITKSDSWSLLDPAAMAVVLDKEIVGMEKFSKNDIILCGSKRGVTTNDFESSKPNVKFIYSLNKDYYKKLLLKIFSAELN